MIFISHAWKDVKPDTKVIEFVDFLRQSGYEAVCDVMLQQEKSAIHFSEMMADALRKAEKTIIVLSEGYKTKADSFSGGVGTEYRYIIDDFSRNENRYILVSFGGRSSQIIPDFLRGRDIVDLSEDKKADYRELFTKLSGKSKFEFAPVANERKVPKAEKIAQFSTRTASGVSDRIGLSFDEVSPKSDLEKKKMLREVYDTLVGTLDSLSSEYCVKNQFVQIECENIDSVTTTFDLYKSGNNVHSVQIWFGNMMGGRDLNIFIGDNVGSKSSFSEMIGYDEQENRLKLTFGMHMSQIDGSIESIVKEVWMRYFQLYLK